MKVQILARQREVLDKEKGNESRERKEDSDGEKPGRLCIYVNVEPLERSKEGYSNFVWHTTAIPS